MEVHFTPETEKKLKDLATQSGRGTDDLLEDVVAGYFDEVIQAREMLDSRYDDLKSGRVKSISRDGVIATSAKRATPLAVAARLIAYDLHPGSAQSVQRRFSIRQVFPIRLARRCQNQGHNVRRITSFRRLLIALAEAVCAVFAGA